MGGTPRLRCRRRNRATGSQTADDHPRVGRRAHGNDPKTSVVNANCQAHDVKNLFVADGSPFVSQADKNPTWTILALSWRTSEYIAEQRKGRRTMTREREAEKGEGVGKRRDAGALKDSWKRAGGRGTGAGSQTALAAAAFRGIDAQAPATPKFFTAHEWATVRCSSTTSFHATNGREARQTRRSPNTWTFCSPRKMRTSTTRSPFAADGVARYRVS